MQKLKRFLQFDTAGWIATSAMLLCAISGILLSVPYDITRAYSSISEILLFNPIGTFVRNFHYWSAQLFFIFTFLHIYDHLKKSTETNIRNNRTWLIMCIVAIFLGYEMISGFILKGDAGGIQARRIVASLLESVPFVGKMLSSTFTGSEDNGQIVYIQHVAAGTIILFIGIYEHVRWIWPRFKTFVLLLLMLIMISSLFRAPLGQIDGSVIKGPWFFVGIQEMLHLTSHPGVIVLLFALLLLMFFLLPRLKKNFRTSIKYSLLAIGILYLAITFSVLLFRGDNWQWQSWNDFENSDEQLMVFDPIKLLKTKTPLFISENQKMEGCLLCHRSMTGLSESHNPSVIGCFSCHKGDPFSTDKTTAHRKMILVPGNFSNVRQTCGTQNCHSNIFERMEKSLMTTQSGIIAVDKFVFDETSSLNDTFHIKKLGHSASDIHLRNLCACCHLGMEKTKTGNADWLERGGGCNACHLHYNNQANESRKRMQVKDSANVKEIHPTIDIQVSNDRCLSCHSRSGRISLNYEGWSEKGEMTSMKENTPTKVLPDKRVLSFVQSDIHHQRGMACIDCHTSYDLMGDGNHHVHKEDAVSVQCRDCHTTEKVNTVAISLLPDKESQMIAWLRKSDSGSKVVLTKKNNRALLNTRVDSQDKIFLIDKLSGKSRESKPPASVCNKGKGHGRLSCESCHTAWVPQCIGCHNSFEKETSGYDLLTGRSTHGTWVEFAGKNFAESPVLGINTATNKVVTAVPGMVLSIDNESFTKRTGNSFHRLYAPTSGHTTQREGRSCKSCHNNSLAIGFGRGELIYRVKENTGKWTFEPRFALNEYDQLPEDGWTGFLKVAKIPHSTRSTLLPFSVTEQKNILEVGSCLTCHDDKSKVMDQALENYQLTLNKRSKMCIISNNRVGR